MERPFVYVNMAMTADGKITSASREHPRFTSEADRTTMDRLRAEADAVLAGAGTIRADDPHLHVRDPRMREYRRSLGKPDGLVAVVVTASGSVDPRWRVFRDDGISARIVATTEDARDPGLAALAGTAEVWRQGRGAVDFGELLRRLKDRGVERLLVEGGGELNWAFVRDDLVDELHVTLAPALLGGRDAPTLLEGEGLPMDRQRKLRLVDLARVGDELYCRYALVRER